jgi:benzoyl-CoA reductase subunit C
MERFRELFTNRHERLEGWKEQTAELIFGYLCTYVPEEILYAAGILPVRIFSETEPITKGEGYLVQFLCPYIRAIFDQALKGKYSYLDGIVQNHTCDGMTHLYAEWNYHIKSTPYSYFLGQPYLKDAAAKAFYQTTLATFVNWLEVLVVRPITIAAFQEAIQVYNEHRELLKELGEMRQTKPAHLLGSEFFEIIRASMVTLKQEINPLIKNFLKTTSNREPEIQPKIRVLVSGGELEDLEVLQLLEECGVQIVSDDLCVGSRYFWNQIQQDSNENPLQAIGDRYIDRVDCPCRDIDRQKRLDHIIKMYKSSEAEGIIFIFQKSCGPHLGDYPYLAEQFSAQGIPHLQLILEHDSTMLGQLKNRVEAFIEMVEGK